MDTQISRPEVNKILILYINKEAGMSTSHMWLRLRHAKRVTAQNAQGEHIFGVPVYPVF